MLYCCLAHSLANNYICYNGKMKGLNAIIAVLPKLPNLYSLKCASSKGPFWPRSAGGATLGAVGRDLGVVVWLPHLCYLVALAALLTMSSERREPRLSPRRS